MKVLVAKFERSMVIVTDEGTYWSDTKSQLLAMGVAVLLPMEHTPPRPGAVELLYPEGTTVPWRVNNACIDPVVLCLARRYANWRGPRGEQDIPDSLEARAEIYSGKDGWPKPDPSIRVVV